MRTCPLDGGLLVPKRQVKLGENLVGAIFADRYQIMSVLGEGGTSIVYKAKHLLMERPVAIKILKNFQTTKQQTLKRFQQEARSASSLNHPNLVTVHDFGISVDGEVYIVMGYIEGISVESIIQREGYLEPETAISMMLQVCDGLAHAHAKGIVHRDVKPSNIILANEIGAVKIVDFGIAKQLPENKQETVQITYGGQICGSPLFMSPEQCRNRPADHRSDIYSAGATLYYALVGHPPFYGSTAAEIVVKHIKEAARVPSTVNRASCIPAKLDEVILRCLAKDPDDRYQSIAELAKDLRETGVPLPVSDQIIIRQLQLDEALPQLRPGDMQMSAVETMTQLQPVKSNSETSSKLSSPEKPCQPGGVNHFLVLTALARKQADDKSYDDAESLYHGAIALAEKSGQQEDHDLAILCVELADLYLRRGKPEAAESLYLRGLKIYLAEYGSENQNIVECMDRLGMLYKERGKYKEAEAALLWSLKMRTKLFSAKSEQVALNYAKLGDLYLLMERLDEADYMQRRATAIREEVLSQTSIGKVVF